MSIINRNDLFYSGKQAKVRTKTLTILAGEGTELAAGTVFVPNVDNKMILPDDTDTIRGWCVLLDDGVDATSDVEAKFGIVGEIDEADLVLAGTISAYTDVVRQSLQLNGIFVNKSTNAVSAANESV